MGQGVGRFVDPRGERGCCGGMLAPFQGLMGMGGETQGVALGWLGAHLWCFDCGV